jgi:hypothetical protein
MHASNTFLARLPSMSMFSGMSSSGNAPQQGAKRSDVIRSLYNQVNWNELIKSEVLRQRDVSTLIKITWTVFHSSSILPDAAHSIR